MRAEEVTLGEVSSSAAGTLLQELCGALMVRYGDCWLVTTQPRSF